MSPNQAINRYKTEFVNTKEIAFLFVHLSGSNKVLWKEAWDHVAEKCLWENINNKAKMNGETVNMKVCSLQEFTQDSSIVCSDVVLLVGIHKDIDDKNNVVNILQERTKNAHAVALFGKNISSCSHMHLIFCHHTIYIVQAAMLRWKIWNDMATSSPMNKIL